MPQNRLGNPDLNSFNPKPPTFSFLSQFPLGFFLPLACPLKNVRFFARPITPKPLIRSTWNFHPSKQWRIQDSLSGGGARDLQPPPPPPPTAVSSHVVVRPKMVKTQPGISIYEQKWGDFDVKSAKFPLCQGHFCENFTEKARENSTKNRRARRAAKFLPLCINFTAQKPFFECVFMSFGFFSRISGGDTCPRAPPPPPCIRPWIQALQSGSM